MAGWYWLVMILGQVKLLKKSGCMRGTVTEWNEDVFNYNEHMKSKIFKNESSKKK